MREIFQSGEAIDPHFSDFRGYTPLHHAAQSGKVEALQPLIDLGAKIDQEDYDGHLPLHLAVRHGHREVAETLIAKGTNPTLLTSQEEGLLHLAAENGDGELMASLLKIAPLRRQIHQLSLHGVSPLHLAASRGHFKSARLLLEAGADSARLNSNRATSLDLAFRSTALQTEHDKIAYHILFGEKAPEPLASAISCEGKSRERAAEERLWEAIEWDDLYGQIFYLAKRASLFLEQDDYQRAALTLNSSYTIAQGPSIPSHCRAFLLSQLERIEELSTQSDRRIDYQSKIQAYRLKLLEARQEASTSLQIKEPIDMTLLKLSQRYRELLSEILMDAIRMKGEAPPTRFAMVGVGSMSRNEICPYSDVEFFFLIEDGGEENRLYFRSISRLMASLIINLGETSFKIIRGEESLSPSGFSLDSGGISPLGKEGLYELIGTPEELAEFQKEEWINHDAEIVLVNAMATSCLITGEPTLFNRYRERVTAVLNGPSQGRQLRQTRALELMRGDIQEFKPKLNGRKAKLGIFDVKKELYRLPQSIVSNLALYYGIGRGNVFQRINQLQEIGVIGPTAALQLKRAFRLIFELRMKTHLFYNNECERIHQAQEVKNYYTTSEIRDKITEIYRTLIPLHEKATAFLNGDNKAFVRSSLYDKSVGTYDDSARENEQFDQAFTLAERSVAIDPNSPFFRNGLGLAQLNLGDARKAAKQFEESLLLFKKKYDGRTHPDIADTLNSLGCVYKHLNNYPIAIEHHKTAIAMWEEMAYDDRSLSRIAINLNNLGLAYIAQGEYQKAVNCHDKTLTIRQTLYHDQPHPEIADSFDSLGASYEKLGNYSKMIECLERALAMRRLIYPNQISLSVAISLGNLGSAYRLLGNPQLAIEYLSASLAMKRVIYKNRPHHRIAQELRNLSVAYKDSKQYDRALEHGKAALQMSRDVHGDRPHPEVAAALSQLGNTYRAMNNHLKGVGLNNASLTMYQQIHDSHPHSDIAMELNNLGNGYLSLVNYPKAIEHFEASLAMKRQIYNDRPHPSIANTLHNLSCVYSKIGDGDQANRYEYDCLMMKKELAGDRPTPELAESFQNLGMGYLLAGEPVKSHEMKLISHDIYLKTVGPDHPDTKFLKKLLKRSSRIVALPKEELLRRSNLMKGVRHD